MIIKYVPIHGDLKITNAARENNGSFNKDDCVSKIQYNNNINF